MTNRKVARKQNPPQDNQIHDKKISISFKNAKQQEAWELYQNNSILFLTGPAGTGKTYCAMLFAMTEILDGKKEKIIISRPVVEAGEKLGFLPGSLEEKLGPYVAPIYDGLEKISKNGAEKIKKLILSKIEIIPLAYCRGRNFMNAVCILDEAQNCTPGQLKMFLTRLCEDSKMIITGDPYQSDLKGEPDLVRVQENLQNISGIGHIVFTEQEIVRNRLIAEILKRI